ncbi:caspase family protein [Acidimicrobiia bacterium EGI L10123]|uniref:caspase family protein n=1 Tax=Salinilacustrithrix flava TaxID=2957203 RepID=UPI003D7C169A|nr:caspase family protein [Acidimicrobiia bacterium EGI L10123]
MTRIRSAQRCLAALALLAPLQVLALTASDGEPATAPPRAAPVSAEVASAGGAPLVPAAGPGWMTAAAPIAAPTAARLVTEPEPIPSGPDPAPEPAPARTATFAERFPAQHAATQDPADPATTRWALLIGINEHRGVADNVGSRQDAEDLRVQLLARGWRDDHILVLTDRQATRDGIVAGIAWLADRTDERSVAVFHYSGHSKKWYGRDVDGGGEVTDEGLWPSDNRFIVDSELVRLLDPVRPHALWLSFATCNAAGLADPGMARPGRILTFSSGEPQKSYEHPSWGNSVWGWLVIDQALGRGLGDLDRDGRVTVEEAFAWARPRAAETTRRQRYGAQEGVIVDLVDGELDLVVPGTPPPPRPDGERRRAAEPASEPEPAAAPDPQPRRAEPTEEDHGNRICLLCGS